MSGWATARLGEVLTHVPRPVEVEFGREYREIGIRSHGKGLFHKAPVLGSELGDKRVFFVEPGDFVLNIVFAWEGAVGRVSEAERGMIASHRFPTFRADGQRLDLGFLMLFFRTKLGLELLGRVSPGGAGRNRTLNRNAFLSLEIPLPSFADQQRLVGLLARASEDIQLATILSGEVERERITLFTGASREIIRRHSSGFPVAAVGTAVTVRGGGTPPKSDPSYWEGEVPWVTPKDMKRRTVSDSIDHISARATEETPAKLIEPGAVLVVTRGMILAHTVPSAVLVTPASINQDMKALIPDSRLDPRFLCAHFWADNHELLQLVQKSTHDTRKLETAKLLGHPVPLLPLADQQRIVAELNDLQVDIDAVKVAQAARRAELDALLPAILDRAFPGAL